MIELDQIRAKKVTIPKNVLRYILMYWTDQDGWQVHAFGGHVFTTPESAQESFLRYVRTWNQPKDGKDDPYKPKYYKVVEVELEIPT